MSLISEPPAKSGSRRRGRAGPRGSFRRNCLRISSNLVTLIWYPGRRGVPPHKSEERYDGEDPRTCPPLVLSRDSESLGSQRPSGPRRLASATPKHCVPFLQGQVFSC